jgi:hypothetical protein
MGHMGRGRVRRVRPLRPPRQPPVHRICMPPHRTWFRVDLRGAWPCALYVSRPTRVLFVRDAAAQEEVQAGPPPTAQVTVRPLGRSRNTV